jgi:hypothetical protein
MNEMSDAQERFINHLSVFFHVNFTRRGMGAWFLDGQTLIDFIINRTVKMNRKYPPSGKPGVEIGLIGVNEKQLIEVSSRMRNDIKKVGDRYEIIIYHAPDYNIPYAYVKLYNEKDYPLVEGESIFRCPPDKVEIYRQNESSAMKEWGTWNYLITELMKYTLPAPYRIGAFLDITQPEWFKNLTYEPRDKGPEIFFNPVRTKNAVQLMKLLHKYADKAGFREYIFPGFGTLLGIIRENDFIQSDRDMDHCIVGWKITKLMEEKFLHQVCQPIENLRDGLDILRRYPKGLMEGRWRNPKRRKDNQRLLWFSCGHLKPGSQQGCKSCVWKFFEHDEYAWHSKGTKWVRQRKFDQEEFNYDPAKTQAIAKGLKAEYVDKFTQMKFKGITINVPVKAGHCLDAWYPGWGRPAKGASRKIHVMVIPDWNKPKGWYYP